ncbi:acyltransferase family protein [Actinomyces faecalis]|uniref:acyltransferase family protein n=1 Tax=Actinomyces faecalis TaxID=2722820 RepID=UPI00155579B9|nr:acyltransferase [Actinomyces faecalis]
MTADISPKDTSPRFRELDGLRGIAALSVVIGHLTVTYDDHYAGGGEPLFKFTYGAFGVEIFFLISGFVILMTAFRAERPLQFVISRVTRLYPAYWISIAISVILGLSLPSLAVPTDAITIIGNMTMVQRWLFVENLDGTHWTLAVEMQFYLLILILLIVTKCRISRRSLLIFSSLWLAASSGVSVWAYPKSHGIDPSLVPTMTKIAINLSLAQYAPLFIGGAYLFISRKSSRYHPMVAVSGLASVGSAYLLADIRHAAAVSVIYVIFSVVTLRSDSTSMLLWAPFTWLGKISYSLYITHSLVCYSVMQFLIEPIGRNAAMLLAFIICLLVAWSVWRVGENTLSPAWRRAWTRSLSRKSAKQ